MYVSAVRPEIAQPAPCTTASELHAWRILPDLIDGVASLDDDLVVESARQLEELSLWHADWLSVYAATLVCVTGIQRHGPAARCLLTITKRLALSPEQRSRIESMAASL